MADSDYMEFGMDSGDEKITSGKYERFKGKEGETYRMSFVWWELLNGVPDLTQSSPKFIGAKRHYLPGVGYVLDKPGLASLVTTAPKQSVATIIVRWPVDSKTGKLDTQRMLSGRDCDVMPWIFSKTIYEQLKRRHSEFSFAQYDLAVTCTDTTFQKLDLSPCKENLFVKAMNTPQLKAVADDIMTRVKDLAEGMRGMLAQDLSVEKIREKLGGGSVVTGGNNAGTADLDNLLNDIIE